MRHKPLDLQWEWLNRRLVGHFVYFGITGNIKSLKRLHHVERLWHNGWVAVLGKLHSLGTIHAIA